MASFINKLLNKREENRIVFFGEYDNIKVIEAACALLNTGGGWIIVGFDGNKGFTLSSTIDHLIADIELKITEAISPQPLVYILGDHYKEKEVIVIEIVKGPRSPYSFEGKYFIFRGNSYKPASIDEISLLLRSTADYRTIWETNNVIDVEYFELDEAEILETIKEAQTINRSTTLPTQPEKFLSYFQLIDLNYIKNGALVLFGKKPSKFLPQCKITITPMPYGKQGSRYDDIMVISDNLFRAFDRVMNYFKDSLPLVSEFKYDNWNRVVRGKYAFDALDEAIINAMVHRDYADLTGEVTINIYPEKIEIINSGEMPPNIIKTKNKIIPHNSVFRNPLIAHMFWLRGKMEKKGRGLSLIQERFLELGLKSPEWIVSNGYTALTLYSIVEKLTVNDRMIKYVKELKIDESFSREDYEHHFEGQIKEKTARIDISKLVEGGWVIKRGDGPTTKYVRTNKELPDSTG